MPALFPQPVQRCRRDGHDVFGTPAVSVSARDGGRRGGSAVSAWWRHGMTATVRIEVVRAGIGKHDFHGDAGTPKDVAS